ncbi:MAG: hypothetical protein ACTHJ0_16170 [Flavipsychrobacter sp.]
MRSSYFLSAGLAFMMLFAACKKDSTTQTAYSSTGAPQMSYQLKAVNTSSSVGMKRTDSGLISWTAGMAHPVMVKFEARKGGTQIDYRSAVDTTVDLMGSIVATFGGFSIPTGTYNEIELKIDLDKSGATPALELDGTYTDTSGMSTPVTVQINDYVELQTEQHDVTIDSTETFTAVTTLDLSSISAGITQRMLARASLTGGTIVISSSSNRMLYEMILANLHGERYHCEFEHHRRH